MKLCIALLLLAGTEAAFFTAAPSSVRQQTTTTTIKGYLDDLNAEIYAKADNPDIEGSTKEATDLKKDKIDRMGPGDWSTYREFDEFDGGDGQMGVAGDGNTGLAKFGEGAEPALAKSKSMSAKNAWGTESKGYAESLVANGMEQSRAQQMENWMNQQEILKKKNAHRDQTAAFEATTSSAEEDWRTLAKFGVERNQEFDMDETFGGVTAGDKIEGVIELHSRLGSAAIHEFRLKNDYMGFADFRAAFTSDTNQADWIISPSEGSISNREETEFILKFKPNNPGVFEGSLVIETEDWKKTWTVIGSTA